MEADNDFDSESTNNENDTRMGLIDKIVKYKIPVLIVIVFVAAALITNYIDMNISGAAIANTKSDYLESVRDLETQTNEKTRLEAENKDLQDEVNFYYGILLGLNQEIKEIRQTQFGFQMIWDKYVMVGSGNEFTWSTEIKNLLGSEKSYSLDLTLKSNRDGIFDKTPTAGSLTLMPGNSGVLNVRFAPKNEGYAIFGLYVNDIFVGDLVIFST